jgi:hypothetical protein
MVIVPISQKKIYSAFYFYFVYSSPCRLLAFLYNEGISIAGCNDLEFSTCQGCSSKLLNLNDYPFLLTALGQF